MVPFSVKIAIVAISAASLAGFLPPAVAWYRRYRDRPNAEYASGFAVQHLSHMALLAHHVLAILLLLSIDPFACLPYHEAYAWFTYESATIIAASGLILFAAGNVLRIWATYAMGASFDKAVLVKQDHRLVTGGPFRFSRHPIYAGNLLAELGLGMALGSWPLIALTLIVSLPINNWRAANEERLLLRHFGPEYRAYQARVGRWWP